MVTMLERPDVKLDDKFILPQGQIYLSGVQALVRLLIEQRARDRATGLDTRGFVSGYRGSPLGGFDTVLWQQEKQLNAEGIVFSPGLNEDLAATALWGTQQVGLFGPATTGGVFGLWYGKGPGIDRSLDALKHANLAGTAPNGGVLAIAGDDHISQSSTLAHQSDQTLIAAMIPILNPSSVQEYLDFGLLGYALSRFSGCWVGFKALAETVESSASISVDPARLKIMLPADFAAPASGLHIRWPDPPLIAEARLHGPKMAAVAAFARANRLDRVMTPLGAARLGIVASGKSYLDVRQALIELGIADRVEELGIRVYKVGLSWPLESEGALAFAQGLDEVLVVEEKQPLIESQLTRLLYNLAADRRPRIVGKVDERSAPLLPSTGQLGVAEVARAIHLRLRLLGVDDSVIAEHAAHLDSFAFTGITAGSNLSRVPFFCSGCPHNSSTKLPEGSRAHGGIGCHGMATFMPERNTPGLTQMGGEGANWIGQAPFSADTHIFQNMGDGTYAHSGLLAIRAAVAAGVNITYKILYNDAVAMTGGQQAEGEFTVAQIVAQVAAEGVAKIVVVSDEPGRHAGVGYPASVELFHRDRLDEVQRSLREVCGTTVLVYEQTCAAEKRRRRKRGLLFDPPKRVFINPEVCEGCGDCSVASNCISVTPLETELGRKRQIDQSSCNKDYSCIKGFCPSFVIVEGGTFKGKSGTVALPKEVPLVPLPAPLPLDRPWNILIAGIGGTGVVTIGALLGMAAHLAGRGCTVSDFTGLSQKNGAVSSHVRLAAAPEHLHSVRIAPGAADLLLAYDQIVATTPDILSRLQGKVSQAVINSYVAPPTGFVANPELDFGEPQMRKRLTGLLGERATFVDATRCATGLLGDAIGANLFLLGFAFQRGLIPLPLEAIDRAIELNGASVTMNRRAFAWGRLQAHDPVQIVALLGDGIAPPPQTVDDIVADRRRRLIAYQNESYAGRFLRTIDQVKAAEARIGGSGGRLTEVVAKSLYKLMAYKDEYEVARLHTATGFRDEVCAQFDGTARLTYSFAPPLIARRDSATGHLVKRRFGPWMHKALWLLAKGRGLRGTRLDPFGYLADRKLERALIEEYEAAIGNLLTTLDRETLADALIIAELPMAIKGYGHVKDRSIDIYRERISAMMMQFTMAHRHQRAS